MNTEELDELKDQIYDLQCEVRELKEDSFILAELKARLKKIEKRRLNIVFHSSNKWTIEDKNGEVSCGISLLDAINRI